MPAAEFEMTAETVMIMLLLLTMNSAFGLYIYIRFGPKQLFMIELPEEEQRRYKERLPPLSKLNGYGRKLFLFSGLTVAISLLLLSELFSAL